MSAKDMDDISAALQALKFRKRLFGGVDERDVWRQLDGLQKEYERLYELQEARFQALLEDRENTILALRRTGLEGRFPASGQGVPEGRAHG